MDEKDIRKYAQLMKELGLTGLEVTEDNRAVRLERMVPGEVEATGAATVRSEPDGGSGDAAVISPMVGVFYPAPAENAEPFVRLGSRVRKGDTLCIIEAMKLMNAITAEQDGTIVEICAQNGQVVEYGTVLFRIGA